MSANRSLDLLASFIGKHRLVVLLSRVASLGRVVSLSLCVLEELLFQGNKVLLDFLPVGHPL